MKVLLTGATSPIGRVLAEGLSADGHELHLHGKDLERLTAMVDQLRRKGAQIEFYIADLARPYEVAEMLETVSRQTGRIDLLINNAFGRLEKTLADLAPGEAQEFFQVSVVGTVEVIRASLPLLQKSPTPRIVNIVADWGFPMHNIMTGPSAYIAAKYACHGLGAALQTELSPFKIRTTNLCPGIVATDVPYEMYDDDFVRSHGVNAIHPKVLVDAIRFLLTATTAHVRSIVLSPNDPGYNGL